MGRFNIRNYTKEERKYLAVDNYDRMSMHFGKEIKKSSDNSSIWAPFKIKHLGGANIDTIFKVHDGMIIEIDKNPQFDTEIMVSDIDTVGALFFNSFNGRVGVLNFASYKNPGGMYLEGSPAQEEALCHSSFLYNVLIFHKDDFYKRHLKTLNRALYTSELLFTPDILFADKHEVMNDSSIVSNKVRTFRVLNADVLTIAAPNIRANTRWNKRVDKDGKVYGINVDGSTMSESQYRALLTERIKLILDVAIVNEDFNLILGAFGCGVFGNDPYMVASVFRDLLHGEYKNVFNKVIFAVPKGADKTNFNAFMETLN